MKTAIIGGGIGGLTAALAFHRAGAEVTVFEQAARPSVVGAGIQLGPNAVHVLDALGLGQALRAVANRPEAVFLRDGTSGQELARIRFGQEADKKFGAPFLQIHRGELSRVLHEAAQEAGIAVKFDALARLSTEAQVSVGKASAQYDLCVIADGIHSRARLDLLGGAAPVFSGHVAYRATVEAPAPDDGGTNWLSAGRHMVVYPMQQDGQAQTNIVAITKAETGPGQGWSNEVTPDAFRAEFAGMTDAAQSLLNEVKTARAWGLYTHEPLRRWSRGKVVALGDAVHAMLPFLAQGAGMAIEDAWVLTHAMAKKPSLPKAFDAYEAARRPRVEKVMAASKESGRIYHMGGPMRLARNLAMPVMSARLQTRLDWLYAYNPVAAHPLD